MVWKNSHSIDLANHESLGHYLPIGKMYAPIMRKPKHKIGEQIEEGVDLLLSNTGMIIAFLHSFIIIWYISSRES